MNTEQTTKLKPVTFIEGKYDFHREDDFRQRLLLKCLTVTSDPKKLREMIGVRTVAEVYRTLDKLAMRREYHDALARQGIEFDDIVAGIKNIAQGGEDDTVRLKAWQTILRSLGLDTYKEESSAVTGWEAALLKVAENKPKELVAPNTDYEVKIPPVPEDEILIIGKEEKAGRNLYAN